MEKLALGERFRSLEEKPRAARRPAATRGSGEPEVWKDICEVGAKDCGNKPNMLIRSKASIKRYQVCVQCWSRNKNNWTSGYEVLFSGVGREGEPHPAIPVGLAAGGAGMFPCSYPTGRHNRPTRPTCHGKNYRNLVSCTRAQGHPGRHHAMDYVTGKCLGEWV